MRKSAASEPVENAHRHRCESVSIGRLLLGLAVAAGLCLSWIDTSFAWGSRRYFTTVYEAGTGPVRLFAEERGSGRPILLLHGIGGSTYTWRRVAPLLARGNRVIAIDMKGFGRSSKPVGTRYTARDQARLVAQFLAANNLEGVTLVGHSFGGTVSLALLIGSRSASERIERLVLVDSPAYPQKWPTAAELLSGSEAGEAVLSTIPPEVTVKLGLASTVQSRSAFSRQDIAIYAQPLYEPGGIHAVAETARDLMATDFASASHHYHRISQPTLIVWCREDPVVPIRTAYQLRRALSNSSLKIADNCAHVPPEEIPGRFATWLKGFVIR